MELSLLNSQPKNMDAYTTLFSSSWKPQQMLDKWKFAGDILNKKIRYWNKDKIHIG